MKNRKRKLIKAGVFISAIILTNYIFGQTVPFITEGKITFERKINAYSFLRNEYEETSPFYIAYKAAFPTFNNLNFTLLFNGSATLYRPDNNVNYSALNFLATAGYTNNVWFNLAIDSALAYKRIYNKPYIIKDRIRKIRWKMTEETRDIIGFHCHRANAIIMDSVYVIAFYTDKILTNSGPESFCGLPGMILGIAIPRLHTTWFATSVIAESVPTDKLYFPLKGNDKIYNNTDLQKEVPTLLDKIKKSYSRLLIEMLL